MDLSPSTLPTINKQRLPASPLVDKNLVNNNKVAGGSSNKLAGKTASFSLPLSREAVQRCFDCFAAWQISKTKPIYDLEPLVPRSTFRNCNF